jgi:AhpD family alkylhydroperoxidase
MLPVIPTPSKRTYTPKTLMADIAWMLDHLDDVRAAHRSGRVDKAFAERIMLAVTNVNGCRYCDYFHARQALTVGIDEAELQQMYAGEFGHLPEEQTIAIAFAQHFAEQQGKPDPLTRQRLQTFYGPDTARDIMAYIHMITMGNLLGNTADALLFRLQGKPMPGSRFIDELAVALLTVTLLPSMMLGGVIGSRINKKRRG